LSSETQIARIFRNNNITAQGSNMNGSLYRYYADGMNQTATEVLPKGIAGIKLVDYNVSGGKSCKNL
jgi:hypothetical protein